MTPNVTAFTVIAFDQVGLRLICPLCASWADLDPDTTWPTVADVIDAAGKHIAICDYNKADAA